MGCGLCDIIGDERFRTFKRIGIDCCKEVIYAAKEEYCSENLELFVGGFDDIRKQSIDYLITVNFLHEINDEDLHQIYNRLFTENKISMYIVDEVTGNYQHIHNYSKLIPQQYSIIHSLGPYKSDGGERYIKIFKLNE